MPRPLHFTPEIKDRMVALVNDGKTIREVTDTINAEFADILPHKKSPKQVYEFLYFHGVKAKERSPAANAWTPQMEADLEELLRGGKTYEAAGELLGKKYGIKRAAGSVYHHWKVMCAKNPALEGVMQKRGGVWSEAVVARLFTLQGEGVSFRKIAEALSREFGVKMTRNMVCSKLHRAGKSTPRKKGRPHDSHLRKPVFAKIPVKNEWRTARKKADKRKELCVGAFLLTDLTDKNCKWPNGDTGFFCGEKILRGEVYCATHKNKAYADTNDGGQNEK